MKSNFSDWIKRDQILWFFLLTLALSWAIWIPAAAASIHGKTSVLGPDGLIGGMARWLPGLVAILLSFLFLGKAGVGSLFRPIRTWRVGPFWYLFALLFQVAVFYGGRLIDTLTGNLYEVTSPLYSVYGSQAALMAPMVILFAFPGAFAEELGWRGYVLPRLQNKLSALTSSLIVAFFWGAWHIPLLIYFGELEANDIAGMVWAVVEIIPIAIIYTWIYNNTRGSLLLVTLFHIGQQLSNNLLGVLPSSTDEILVWVVAAGILIFEGAENLSRRASKHRVAD